MKSLSRLIKANMLAEKLLPIFILLSLVSPLPAQNLSKFEPTKVMRIVDGDTLKVNYKGKEESVRLIGIDAPESRPNKKAKMDVKRSGQDLKTIIAMGKEATKYVKTLVKPGDSVKIEFDVRKRDKYRRLLAYVYLPNGTMLNEEIVKDGYANLMTIPPNVKYQERFLKAYREAMDNKRGLWKE